MRDHLVIGAALGVALATTVACAPPVKQAGHGLNAAVADASGPSHSDAPGGTSEPASIDAVLDFQQLSLSEEWGPCPGDTACYRRIDIGSDHVIKLVDRGKTFGARLSDGDLAKAASLATNAPLLDALRKDSCTPALDESEQIRIWLAPGLLLYREVSGCDAQEVVRVKEWARALAKSSFPESTLAQSMPPDLPAPLPLPAASLAFTPAFTSLELTAESYPCPGPGPCRDSVAIEANERTVTRQQRQARREWRDVDLGEVPATAASGSLLKLLLLPGPCLGAPDITEVLTIGVGEHLFLRNEITGCNQGPAAEARDAVMNLVGTLP
jgi:hypothetical protein